MVMATSGSCRRQSAASSPQEAVEGHQSAEGVEAMALHNRLVAYVHAIDNPQDGRSDVWVEHSYALCGRGACGAGGGPVRELLCARPDALRGDHVDVEAAPPPPPEPPALSPPGSAGEDTEEEGEDDEWEARLASLAPHADHARLAAAAVDCLRRVRLAKLAGGRFGERCAVAEQARRLRLALAPLWAGGGGGGGAQRPGPWLHAALFAVAPPGARRTYERLVRELRRAVPRLAERLTGARGPPVPLTATVDRTPESEVDPEPGPWLVWVGGGRWARRLGALLHTRALPLAAATQPPEAWCASVAGSVRAAFADILAEAGSRGVVVGGCGGGAALAGALASGGAVRGALLLAPALLTAEGPREGSGRLTRGPALIVAGSRAAQSWRGALCESLAPRQRLLLVGGAGDALRLPAAQRRRRRLTQDAVDAAVAEECVRWIHEICEETDDEPEDDPQLAKQAGASGGTESSEEEYAHLPAARSPPAPAPAAPAPAPALAPAPASGPAPAPAPPVPVPPLAPLAAHTTTAHTGNETRSIEIVEGRVVSRVSGSTPLALLPPRRAEPRGERRAERLPERRAERRPERREPVPLAAADIMQLPIVFADDERTIVPHSEAPVPVAEGAVTVTSGARRGGAGAGAGAAAGVTVGARRGGPLRYTRVIVAKRAAPPSRPPLLVRRGLRLVRKHTDA